MTRALMLLMLCAGAGAACRRAAVISPPAQPALEVEVISAPSGAQIHQGERAVGIAPAKLRLGGLGEVLGLRAELSGQQVVERRIRILGPDQVQLLIRFGSEPTPLARALGLSRILVFDNSTSVAFDTDQALIKPDFGALLEQQAQVLNDYFGAVDVFVCGHTDGTGGRDHNLELSLARAQAVTDALVRLKVDRARLKPHGLAADYPLEANETTEGRARNRRTELVLPD